jgi:autotransporter translocation and assembly factor TamB
MRSNFWRVLFGILVALAVPIVVVLVLSVLILSIPPVGRYALSQALIRGGPRVGVEVRFGGIEGNIMRSITLTDFVARLGPDSLKVKKLYLTYDPWTSIRDRNFAVSSAGALEPRLFLSSKRPQSGQSGGGRTRYPAAQIGQFRLSGGTVFLDTVQRLDSVNLVLSLRSVPEQLLVGLSEVRGRLCREQIPLRDLAGRVRLTPDSLVVTELTARTAGSFVRAGLRMAFQPSAIAVRLESLSVSLPEVAAAAPVGQRPSVRGRFRAAGDVGLDKNQPSGAVRYTAEGLVWQAVHLPTIDGKLGLRDSVVQVTLTGADSGLGSVDVSGRLDLRRLDFSGSAKLVGIPVRQLDSMLPDVRIDADIEVSGRGFDSVEATVTARAPDLDIEQLKVSGSYLRAGQRVALEQFELSGPVGVASGHGTWQGGRVQAEVRMDSLNLGLLARLESLPVQGRVSGRVSLAGTAETLDATGELSVSDLQVAGFSATSARTGFTVVVGRGLSGQVQAAVDGASYGGTEVDSVRLTWQEQQFSLGGWRPGFQVAAEGRARLARDSIGIDVTALRIVTGAQALAFNDALQLSLRRDSLDVRFVAAGLAGGDVRAAFASAAGKPPRIEATLSRVDLARLKALLGFDFDVSGTASLNVAGSDSFDVVIDVEQLSIPVAGVELNRVQGTARLSRTRAEINHLWLVHRDSSAVPETSVVTGSVEYKTEGGFELGAADLRARLRNPGVWVVFYLKPIIELRQGTIYGDLAVRGSLVQPMFDGRVRISRAQLGVPIIGTTFDRVNAELVFDRSRINIEKLSGRSDHGDVLVTGFVDIGRQWLVDSLRFHGDFSGTTINPMPEIYGVIGGSLDLDWTLGRPFSLSGTVNVEEALVAFGFGQSAGSGTGAPDTLLTYDVRVRGDRNIWFRNQLADIELACDLTVRKTTKDVLYSGKLTSRQGSIYYLDHTLRVGSGSVRFDNINTLNPEFNVAAGKPIRNASKEPGLPDTISLKLTGTLEQPSFDFRSVPPIWDETEIISYLTLNATQDQLQDPGYQQKAVTNLLSSRLLGYFQTQVSKRARGFVNLDYLEFESGLLNSSEQTRVTVGKYVGRNLYVSYTQSFTGDLSPSFRVEYYIDRKNQILAEGTSGDQYRTSLRYQLKLRY